MTSSNAAPTVEGHVAVAKPSPPPDTATAEALPVDANAPGAAATASSITTTAELNVNIGAPSTLAPLKTTDEAFVDQTLQHFTLADLAGSQLQRHQTLNEANTDLPILSPPTVSPLSTPAATNINIDDGLPDEVMAKLAADLPPLSLSRDPSIFRSGILGPQQSDNAKATSMPDGMELDEPFLPEDTNYNRRDQLQAIATTDPDPHDAEYSHGLLRGMRLSQGSIDPSAYMMNLAAQATLFNDHGPPVIDPSAVSLQSFTQDSEALTGSAGPASLNESQKLESFAKIEFADSTFQMTTYAVIIGRDQQAMAQARADERREAAYRRRCEENERNGLPPPTPVMYDRGKFSKSYVSEEGGMLGPEHSDGEDVKPAKRRRPSSAAPFPAGEDNVSGDHVQSNRQYVSHTPGAAAVDMSALQPSPGHIPFIGIHSPGPDIASKTRGISRQHLKIQFNKKRGVFEGIALHKNGFFCEDILYGLDNPATLRSGDRLQIKDVEFFFVINGVQIGMSGGEDEDVKSTKRMSIGGKEMSLDFEHSDHENFRDTSDELSDVENTPTPDNESEHSDEELEAELEEVAQEPATLSVEESRLNSGLELAAAESIAEEGQQHSGIIKTEADFSADMAVDMPPEFAMPDIPKRRGPGRPPKDGIMSKRERRLLKKQLQETSKKALPQDPQEEKIKRPVGRPRKNPLPEEGEQPEKRKYNKKKREDGEVGSDVEKRIKEKKDKKVRPKSPPLDLRREDYTAEQLQKPTKNYGVLIDEALTNGPPDGLTLKQIYKRITAKYPWFYFTAETKGWESSVRHNLIGNEAFKKDEETGLWSRVPGVELDAGKKRKVNSPDRHLGPTHLHPHLSHSPYYQNSPYTNPGSVTYAHGLPSYSTEQKHLQPGYTAPLGQNTQLHPTTSQPVSQPVYSAHVPAPAQLPASYSSLGLQRASNTPQQSTYSSPYARPPPPTNPPAKLDSSTGNSQPSVALPSTQSATSAQQPPPRPTVVNTTAREQLSPEIERAIVQFSANMLEVISERTPHAASIIEAAANRIRGLPVQNRVPGFESVETTLVNAMQIMIKDMKRSHQNTVAAPPPAPVQTSSTPSPAPPNTVEAEIQRRLRNFRESMVTALKTKTDKAEIVVDSAINRARGLPHAGKIPGWEEADNLMVKSVTQIIAEARSAYNLRLQNSAPIAVNNNRTTPSQPAQSALRREPSAAPAPALTATASVGPSTTSAKGIAAAPYTPSAHPSVSAVPNLNALSMARPVMPLQRPAPVALPRPLTTTSMTRPTTVLQKEPATTPSMVSTTAPPSILRPNVSSPAPPSAGVLDQITGHKRFTDDAFHKSHSINNITASNHASSSTSVSSNAVHNSGVAVAGSSSLANPAPSSTTATSVMSPLVKEGNNATGTISGSGLHGLATKTTSAVTVTSKPVSSVPINTPTIHTSGPSNSIATKPVTSTPSNTPSSIASKPLLSTSYHTPSIPASLAPSNVVSKPLSIASSSTQSIPANLAPKSVTNIHITSAPIKAQSIPANLTSSSGASIPTSSAISNTVRIPATSTSSHTTNGATNSTARDPTIGIMGSHTGVSLEATNAETTKNNAVGNINGATPKSMTGNMVNPPANSTVKTNTLEIAKTDNGDHVTALSSSSSIRGAIGTTASLTPGQTRPSISNANNGIVIKTTVVGTMDAKANQSLVESVNSKAESEKGTPACSTTTEHHDPVAFKTPAPIHNMSSPAPPSAGVVDQIAGHKRSIDEGPGSANGDQPEPKRLGMSAT